MDETKVKQKLLENLFAPYQNCTLCPLAKLGRTNIVFGEGNPNADLMLIGEGPGRDEDRQGRPFIGRSGILLTKTLKALGIARDDLYIANIVKCRPPNNRAPLPNELSICKRLLLEKQIRIIKPKVICTLGSCATRTLLQTKAGITQLRGSLFSYQSIQLIPTFHPAYLLRNPKELYKMALDLESAFNLATAGFSNNKIPAHATL